MDVDVSLKLNHTRSVTNPFGSEEHGTLQQTGSLLHRILHRQWAFILAVMHSQTRKSLQRTCILADNHLQATTYRLSVDFNDLVAPERTQKRKVKGYKRTGRTIIMHTWKQTANIAKHA